MSRGYSVMHSHSSIERDLKLPKRFVLVDEEFKDRFISDAIEPFKYNGVKYYKVPTLAFVEKGGVFKNLAK